MTTDLAVVIVSFETRDATLACLEAVSPCGAREIVVVDNASTDGTAAAIRARFPEIVLVQNPENLGFSVGCNRGWRRSRARNVLFLNTDARVPSDGASRLLEVLEAEADAGIVGPRIVDVGGRIEVSTGPDLGLLSEMVQRRLVRGVGLGRSDAVARAEQAHSRPRDVAWVSGACLLARRATLEAVSGFDEAFFLYEEDADLCLRARKAGWRVLFSPAVTVRHERGVSMARVPGLARLAYHRSHLRYYRKHRTALECLALRLMLGARAGLEWTRGRARQARALARTAIDTRPL